VNIELLSYTTKWLATLLIGLLCASVRGDVETLPRLQYGKPPQSFEQLWAGYDPAREPLDVEVLREWEEDGVVLRVLRYRIGVFGGRKTWMAAVYGYPKRGRRLPGLVQMHGGGQYADYRAPLTNAKRGYATISLAWAGRINAPGYNVGVEGVKLFLEQRTDAVEYRVTTDWGPLDGYHAPRRGKLDFSSVKPSEWTLDSVDSPRNTGWFLCTLAARRALTFLQQQPEVDPERLGVYGHSMGGKLTVLTAAADRRVKAAAPSCGGVSDRYRQLDTAYKTTISDAENLQHVTCPIIFLSPANDFHGRIADLQTALGEIASPAWRVTNAPHHDHQDTAEYQAAGLLWFDDHLQGRFRYPETPRVKLELSRGTDSPAVTVAVDATKPVSEVVIYYATGDDAPDTSVGGSIHTRYRYWRHARAQPGATGWTAVLPLFEVAKPLWVYANVRYGLAEPVKGAGYYYGIYTTNTVVASSRMQIVTAAEIAAANVRPALMPELIIERFANGWEKAWYSYKTDGWEYRSHNVFDPQWAAPAGAALVLDARSEKPNSLVIRIDAHAAVVPLAGGLEWQRIRLQPSEFQDVSGDALAGWNGIGEICLSPGEDLKGTVSGKRSTRRLGGVWQGATPEFRDLRWEPVPATAKPAR
jgi:hypothetical protein